MRNPREKLLTRGDEAGDRWRKYFEQFLNVDERIENREGENSGNESECEMIG